ncbi:MAG: hypothetical protein ACRDLF_00265 [Solirubrobacteraceae bacterium]
MEGKEAPNGPGKEAPKAPGSPRRKQPAGGEPARKRRLRCGAFPEPLKGDVPYAKSRPELAGMSLGEQVRIIMGTPAWHEVLRPILDALDKDRPKKGPKPSYSSEELESCLLYQRMAGVATYAEARALLAGDRGARDRAVLGFDKARDRVGRSLRLVTSFEGVPSEATVWRHKRRFGLDEHARAYRELFERLLEEHFEEFPKQMSEEARLVHWDGSVLLSHYSSDERVSRATGEVKPPTLTGGDYRPRTKSNWGKDGHGFNLVACVTQTGLPLGAQLTPINVPEAKTAKGILEDDWRRIVAPYLEDDLVRVMAFDAAYSGGHMRKAVHRAGFVPNCHPVSHADRPRSMANADKKAKAKLKIRCCKNWHLNGHHELFCACGQGKTMRRAEKKVNGEAVCRLEGSCPNCGPVSLTAGQWRLFGDGKTGKSVAEMSGKERAEDQANEPETAEDEQAEDEQAEDQENGKKKKKKKAVTDWRIGNPLTYDDPLSAKYGSARFGHNEGWHGQLVSRFGLLKEKAWVRDRRQSERDLLQVFCAMHALAKEQRRRSGQNPMPAAPLTGAGNSGPPPPALARAA